MMMNLFSSFDPTTILNSSMNWLAMILGLMLLPTPFWILPSKIFNIITYILSNFKKEFNTLSPKTSLILPISLMTMILLNNSLGLVPYVFTSTSHIALTLALALPIWLSFMIFGWTNKTLHMPSHLIPSGTPALLMPFMVSIETTSNFIRPLTLSVRLAANMMAGHLLITLMSNIAPTLSTLSASMLITTQILLMLLESAVAIIQAYVFTVLSVLYWSETN